MQYSTDDEMFNSFLEKTTRIELAIALAAIGVTTVVKLLGQRGMNQDPISDPGTLALLNKPSHTQCRRGLWTASSSGVERRDWHCSPGQLARTGLGLGTAVPALGVGLGLQSRPAGRDWTGLGTGD